MADNIMDILTESGDAPNTVDSSDTVESPISDAPSAEQQSEAEVLDIQNLAEKYMKKSVTEGTEIEALKRQIAELTEKLNAIPAKKVTAEPDIFTEENFSRALENPQLFKQGLSKMIAGTVQESLQSFQDMIRKTAENVSANHVQQSAAAIEARTIFKSSFPDLAPYDDFVKLVATSLAPKFEGNTSPQEFLNIVGNVSRQRLAAMGVAVNKPGGKKPVLPNVTPGTAHQTQTPTRTIGQSFIENIFGGE